MATLNVKLIDSSIFENFKKLTNDEQQQRVDGTLSLIQQLSKDGPDEKKDKEQDYILKRIIRGLGAATSSSKSGFYTTFLSFLSTTVSANVEIGTIFEIMNKELSVGTEVTNKEDSDCLVGHILLCAALLRSKRILQGTDDDIKQWIEVLLKTTKFKQFHASLAYNFLIDLMEKIDDRQFIEIMWPIVREKLERPWEKQTINTIHFMILVQHKYPNIVDKEFLKKSLKTSEILTPLAYKHIGRLFWCNTSSTAFAHPAYDALGMLLKNSSAEQVTKFWSEEINESLAAPNKIKEIITLKILKDILENESLTIENVQKLITKRFVKMITNSLTKSDKNQKHEYLSAFYDEFFENLIKFFGKSSDDKVKAKIISILILHPGTLMFERYTSNKVIHQLTSKLNQEGIRELFELYKKIFTGKVAKDPDNMDNQWNNSEKQHVLYMMQHLLQLKAAREDIEWRAIQMKFLLNIGLLYTKYDGTPVHKSELDVEIVPKDLSLIAKNVFFGSLHVKMTNLKDEKEVLFNICSFLNEILEKSSSKKCIRELFSEKSLQSWKSMYEKVTKKSKNKKIDLVFHILFIHMGLQLFKDPAMAETAIADLEKCLENANKKSIGKKETLDNREPEWIEVIVDLFLHLLSQNTHILRTVVNNVFPHLCQYLNLTSIYQILSVLDMKDGKNPLSRDNEMENENDSDSDDNDDKMDESDSSDDSDNFSVDNDEDELMEEEGTVTDQLRNAISTALGSAKPDTDTESIDLNDMNDEDVDRLDNALSAAFQIVKKSNPKKKSKQKRATTTMLMHFRIRVLDLIDIYLSNKSNLAIFLEILTMLLNMTGFCTEKELEPLAIKVNRLLRKLLAFRQFDSVDDVILENFIDLLKNLMERKMNINTTEKFNEILSKCFSFIVHCTEIVSQKTNSESSQTVLALTTDYIEEFLQSRNPLINFNLLRDIFKIRWIGIWHLGKTLAKSGLSKNVRIFRRIQTMELLAILYKNHGFIKQDIEQFNKFNKFIEKPLNAYLKRFTNVENSKKSTKEFFALISLLSEMYKCKGNGKIESLLNWTEICEQVQSIRKVIALGPGQLYAQFCKLVGIKMIEKVQKIAKKKKIVKSVNKNIDEFNGRPALEKKIGAKKETNGKSALKKKVVKKETNGKPLKKRPLENGESVPSKKVKQSQEEEGKQSKKGNNKKQMLAVNGQLE